MLLRKVMLLSTVNNFRGAQLKKHVKQSRQVPNDPNILSIISGEKI